MRSGKARGRSRWRKVLFPLKWLLHRSAYFLPSFALYGVSSEGRVVAKSILLFTSWSSFFLFTIELFILFIFGISFGSFFSCDNLYRIIISFDYLNKFVEDKRKEIVFSILFPYNFNHNFKFVAHS